MDLWKYFAIGHEDHVFCNPTSEAKVDEIVELLELPEGGRVLDIACGKGEFLARVAGRWKCGGVGVDLSPYFVAEARARARDAGLVEALELVEANGADYDGEPESFELSSCLGASWIWGGHAATLRALAAFAKPGGLVVVGEPFWRSEPPAAYLAAAGVERSSFGTHAENARAGEACGLALLHTIVSNEDDWDRYEGYQWRAARRYALRHPDDPDLPELRDRMCKVRDTYLEWGRATLGWSVYLFLKRGT